MVTASDAEAEGQLGDFLLDSLTALSMDLPPKVSMPNLQDPFVVLSYAPRQLYAVCAPPLQSRGRILAVPWKRNCSDNVRLCIWSCASVVHALVHLL